MAKRARNTKGTKKAKRKKVTKTTKKAKNTKKAAKKKPAKKKVVKKKPAKKKPAKKLGVPKMAASLVADAITAIPSLSVQVKHEPNSGLPWAERNYIGVRLFAGAPDPRWEIPAEVAKSIAAELSALPESGNEMDFPDEGDLYGGVIVQVVGPNKKRQGFLLFDGMVLDTEKEIVRFDRERKIEGRLYKTMPQAVFNALDNTSFESASVPLPPGAGQHGVKGVTRGDARPQCQGGPRFDAPPPLSKWDKFPGIQDNNCYNYANDEFSHVDDAQPGRLLFENMTENEMHLRLVSDHLIPVAPDRKRLPAACHPTAGANLVAITLRRRAGTKMENGQQVPVFRDFHCFRLDATGTWSHKDGAHRSRKTDKNKKPLLDLADAQFAVEHVLVGYYWSVPGHRRIGMPQNV